MSKNNAEPSFGHSDISRLSEVFLEAAEAIANSRLDPLVEVTAITPGDRGEIMVVSSPEATALRGIQILSVLRGMETFKGEGTGPSRQNRQTIAHVLSYGLFEIYATIPAEKFTPPVLNGVRSSTQTINNRLLGTYHQKSTSQAVADRESLLYFRIAQQILHRPAPKS